MTCEACVVVASVGLVAAVSGTIPGAGERGGNPMSEPLGPLVCDPYYCQIQEHTDGDPAKMALVVVALAGYLVASVLLGWVSRR